MNDSVQVSIKQLDGDTALVSVCAGQADCSKLDEALGEAERLGTPGLVIDLSELSDAGDSIVASVTEFQKRCIGDGRWLLVMPPSAALAEFFVNLV
jgi:anti-anti-sigma regulatory factor